MSISLDFAKVGEFPPPLEVPRSSINPLDKSTVISIFPRPIHEQKWTMFPGEFFIPAGSHEKPGLLVVGSSSWWRPMPNDEPILEIPVPSVVVADSIVRDYCAGILGCNMADATPGLFFVPGEFEVKEVKEKYSKAIAAAKARQEKWFQNIIRIADSLWARTNGNPLTINDDMRLAANYFGMLDKPWLQDFVAVSKVKCFACGNLKDPQYPICPNCRTIDPDHPRAKDIKVAAVG